MQSDLRNCIYYFVKRKSNTIPTVNDSNVRVCFILQRTEIFTSVQSIFEAMCADARFSVSILVLPRYDHAKRKVDVSTIKKNVEFCENLNKKITIINSFDENTNSFIDIHKFNFDFIFLGLPYTAEYPKEYDFKYFAQNSRLCYVPYGSSYADGREMLRVSLTIWLNATKRVV